jgi:predicted CXXCH cytochrome family protein
MRFRHVRLISLAIAASLWLVAPSSSADEGCLDCHGSPASITDAAASLDVTLTAERASELVIVPDTKSVHEGLGCLACHKGASELPHKKQPASANPCVSCHTDEAKVVAGSAHGDGAGGFVAVCWDCHTAHHVRPLKDPDSPLSPAHVAARCLQCHDKQAYLAGVHGQAVQLAGLDVAATCISCHGSHDILSPKVEGSRVARRNVSFTCGKCHGRVAQTYRRSVHGAALTEHDNPDVPTCVDCHQAHATPDPRSQKFRLASPELCAKCHANARMMAKYGISISVFATYVADFHGTTAELFQSTSPNQPLNQAVCYDCHGFHDVQSVKGVGQEEINRRLLVRCQVCHPGVKFSFLSAWTYHYVPSPKRYALIYYVRLFYRYAIPSTVGFFLLYIGVDVWGRRRRRRT